ncbi:MAG: helix-hairpin-helix domain-containing protein [Candidatus Hodarchaeota archaeon]
MSFKLEDVKGLGKKAGNLKDAGIDSVENLANAKEDDLIKIKGIGKASAQKFINNAKKLLKSKTSEDMYEEKVVSEEINEEEKKVQEEHKRLEEKKRNLEGNTVEKNDFILVKVTGRTQKGKIFQVSSVDDAKKAGIYDEKKEHLYTPEFVIVGTPGFLNEGLMETIENMNYFEKKSVRIPPTKAFGKRDPTKIERIGIAKFRRMNDGKKPEIGQDFTRKDGQRGTVTNILQGRVIIDYNHPLAGQSLDYNIEVIDKIEDFNKKIEHFMISKGIPKQNVSDFNINYNKDDQSIEFTIPKQFLFQNLALLKFSLAIDLQTHMTDEINDVKFIEIYEKMPIPPTPSESVMEKIEEYDKEHEEQKKDQTDNKK